VIDYTDLQEHEENGRLCVRVELQVRLVYLRKGKIRSEYQKDTLTLCRNDRVMKLNPGIQVIKCPQCNANIDVTKGKCEYCGTKIDSVQEWEVEGAICLNHQIRN
jgi:nitrite reductase/ring-hydroxylating ferredoxin subunit